MNFKNGVVGDLVDVIHTEYDRSKKKKNPYNEQQTNGFFLLVSYCENPSWRFISFF